MTLTRIKLANAGAVQMMRAALISERLNQFHMVSARTPDVDREIQQVDYILANHKHAYIERAIRTQALDGSHPVDKGDDAGNNSTKKEMSALRF